MLLRWGGSEWRSCCQSHCLYQSRQLQQFIIDLVPTVVVSLPLHCNVHIQGGGGAGSYGPMRGGMGGNKGGGVRCVFLYAMWLVYLSWMDGREREGERKREGTKHGKG